MQLLGGGFLGVMYWVATTWIYVEGFERHPDLEYVPVTPHWVRVLGYER